MCDDAAACYRHFKNSNTHVYVFVRSCIPMQRTHLASLTLPEENTEGRKEKIKNSANTNTSFLIFIFFLSVVCISFARSVG